MVKRLGRYTIKFESLPGILGFAAVGGKMEQEGPIGKHLNQCYADSFAGEDSWEKAESKLQTDCVNLALKKCELEAKDIDVIFSGDLLNQCIASIFGLRSLGIPFMGQYGACSTMAQALLSAGIFVESGAAGNAAAVSSSHFCAAERQYRTPLEYGGQRSPTNQRTVTGAGAVIVGSAKGSPYISAAEIGRIIDLQITDVNNMGAAMAPAAAETIQCFLQDTGAKPSDFDMILTGDLGFVGSELLDKLLKREGIDISGVHNDAGMMIFDREAQDVHAGGSGCGCSAAVLCSYILKRLSQGEIKRLLFVGTGALMSPTSSAQKESIPGIAHAVELIANA
ncbi:MAG: stage V sporulation protein AD [Oscillospiraceae bacterium]|jgi:stage V sporulation protein AD|nr:stage V sporulation protein AD [Oscillospiraceae bacterium]